MTRDEHVSRNRCLLFLVATAALLLASGPQKALGQITLSQDFDSGSLDVAKSAVDGLQVTLEPRRIYAKDDQEWGYGIWSWGWVYFKAAGVKDKVVTFRIDASDTVEYSHKATHRYVYSYDNKTWSFFDNGTRDGETYEFSNDDPFTADEVYVAYSLPYPLEMTKQHMAKIKASPYVLPTVSGDANLVVGKTAGGTDDLGRTVAPQDLFGYQITDGASTGPKRKIVLMVATHSGEHISNYLFEGMVNFLIGSDPNAAELRERAVFFCYPQADPDGRLAGYYRSNSENPSLNHNRHWDDLTGFTDLLALEQAMKTDTGGTVDYFFDCHNNWGSGQNYFYYYETNNNETFFNALKKLDPKMGSSHEGGGPNFADGWAITANGLSAAYSYTPEPGAVPNQPTSFYHEMGEKYLLALLEALRADDAPADAGAGDDAAGADAGAAVRDAGASDVSSDDALTDATSASAVDNDESGCSCSVGAPVAARAGIVLLLLVVGRRARRHRRSLPHQTRLGG